MLSLAIKIWNLDRAASGEDNGNDFSTSVFLEKIVAAGLISQEELAPLVQQEIRVLVLSESLERRNEVVAVIIKPSSPEHRWLWILEDGQVVPPKVSDETSIEILWRPGEGPPSEEEANEK